MFFCGGFSWIKQHIRVHSLQEHGLIKMLFSDMAGARNITQLHEGTVIRFREYHEMINVQYFGDSMITFHSQPNFKLFY
jgi:hypothetical protein